VHEVIVHAPGSLGGRRDGDVVLGGELEEIGTASVQQALASILAANLGATTYWNFWMNSGNLHGAMTFMEGLQALKASSKRTWLRGRQYTVSAATPRKRSTYSF
jgi:hypothetical protein